MAFGFLGTYFTDPPPDAPQSVDILEIESGEFLERDAWIEISGVHFGLFSPERLRNRLAEEELYSELESHHSRGHFITFVALSRIRLRPVLRSAGNVA